MNWHQLKPQERDALIAEKVMGLQVEHWTEKERETVDEDGNREVWNLRTGYVVIDGLSNPYVSRYTQDMSAAWQVVRMMNNPNSHGFPGYQIYARFIDALTELVGSDLFFDLLYCDKDGDHLTPERICLAALKAIGE